MISAGVGSWGGVALASDPALFNKNLAARLRMDMGQLDPVGCLINGVTERVLGRRRRTLPCNVYVPAPEAPLLRGRPWNEVQTSGTLLPGHLAQVLCSLFFFRSTESQPSYYSSMFYSWSAKKPGNQAQMAFQGILWQGHTV